jgi:hypothetical protein
MQSPPMGPAEMAYFIFVYFSTKLGTSIDGHEKIFTGKRDSTLQSFLFRQNICRNLKFLTAQKIRFKKKTNIFAIGLVVFAPGTQTCATELK